MPSVRSRAGMVACILAGLLLLLPVAASIAQPAVPDTPAGHALHDWLQAFDSGDRATYQKFAEAEYPSSAPRLDRLMQFQAMSGGFDLKKIESSAPATLIALLEDRNTEQFARVTLTMDATEPNRIASVSLEAIDTPVEFQPAPMNESQLVAAMKAKLESAAAAGRFSGAALLAKNGATIFAQAYGYADRANKTPNTLETRFRIGSMNKMFTATSILQLVQAGKVQLDAPLGTYLTNYPNKDVAKVTIQQLLTHTGGTGDIFEPGFDAHRLELKTLHDYEKLYGSRAPEFPPGSKYEYSNYGFVLLGLVIEKVSGESYYDYVREHVYVPAGMTSTGSEPEDQTVANRSIGYTQSESGQTEPNTNTLPYRGSSAGGGYSTVGDLLNFANALQANKLLDAHHTELLTTGAVDTPNGKYALGFGDRRIDGVRCFGHTGGAPGMSGDLEICPVPGYTIVVLANFDPPAAGISDYVLKRLPH
ncbi:MAG: serine hydrolase domain-containing protein [Candidatus Tumulicola sp.]